MKYPLDFESTFEKSLLFWLTRFIRNKTTSLSNSNITDQTKMAILIKFVDENAYLNKILYHRVLSN